MKRYCVTWNNFAEMFLIHVWDFKYNVYEFWSDKNVVRSCSVVVKGHQNVAVWGQTLAQIQNRERRQRKLPHWMLSLKTDNSSDPARYCSPTIVILYPDSKDAVYYQSNDNQHKTKYWRIIVTSNTHVAAAEISWRHCSPNSAAQWILCHDSGIINKKMAWLHSVKTYFYLFLLDHYSISHKNSFCKSDS